MPSKATPRENSADESLNALESFPSVILLLPKIPNNLASMALSGKSALILGATGLVGFGAALDFLNEGANVVLVARSLAKLEETKKTLISRTKVCPSSP